VRCFRRLRSLVLRRSSVELLFHLLPCSTLASVTIDDCPITDTDLEEMAPKLRLLSSLTISSCRLLSQRGVATLTSLLAPHRSDCGPRRRRSVRRRIIFWGWNCLTSVEAGPLVLAGGGGVCQKNRTFHSCPTCLRSVPVVVLVFVWNLDISLDTVF